MASNLVMVLLRLSMSKLILIWKYSAYVVALCCLDIIALKEHLDSIFMLENLMEILISYIFLICLHIEIVQVSSSIVFLCHVFQWWSQGEICNLNSLNFRACIWPQLQIQFQ